jgi:UDP-N-acetylglucosamine--N-acetylmuramyl-(pentapeptide) pyrophosphoryl-undecaprenol N-acetylglucosamine transferase
MGALVKDRFEAPAEEIRLAVEEHGKLSQGLPRILLAAGGTGGHIFPALAVAQELRARGQKAKGGGPAIEFLGTGRGLEARVIPGSGFRLRTVAAAGLKGIGGLRRLTNLLVLPRSAFETATILREFRPDVVVGVGGYLAGPVMLEAALKDIPTLLIEPNAVPGFTNRVLAPLVRLAAVGFQDAARYYGSKARVTGHAVRKAFFSVPAKEHAAPFTVLVLGGSQGAKAVNHCLVESMLHLVREKVKVIHQTGERDYNAVEGAYRDRGIAAEVHAFIQDVPAALGRADLVVTRAGAATVAELAAAGKASLLIPFPHAADQHQLQNARALERVGAARVVEEQNLTPERLAKEILDLLGSPDRLSSMERAARGFARPDATERIADLVEELAR